MTKDFFTPQRPGFRTSRRREEAKHPVDDLMNCFSQPLDICASPSFLSWVSHLEANGWDLYVAIDVEAVVFGGQHHGAVVHQGDVEALGVFHLALKRGYELAILREDGEVEVVVVVRNRDLPRPVDTDPDRVVRDPFAANLPKEVALIVEDLDAVGTVVTDEDLLPVVDDDPVGELEVLRAAELVEHVAQLVEDDHPHHLALDHNNPPFVVDTNPARVLQDIRPKLPHKLSVLVVDLDLVRRGPLCNDNITGGLDHSHAIRIEQLSVAFSNLSKLELEPPLLVKDLDPVVVGVGHDDVVLGVHGHPAGLRELTLQDPKLAKLAMVDHLLPLDLAFWWIERAAVADWIVLQLGGARRHRGGVDRRLGEKLRCQLHHPVVGG